VALRQPSNVLGFCSQWKGRRYNFRAVPSTGLRNLRRRVGDAESFRVVVGAGGTPSAKLDSVGARLSCSLSSRKLGLKARRSPRSLANASYAPPAPPPHAPLHMQTFWGCGAKLRSLRVVGSNSMPFKSGASRRVPYPSRFFWGIYPRRRCVGGGGACERPRRPARLEPELSGRKRAAQAGSDRVERAPPQSTQRRPTQKYQENKKNQHSVWFFVSCSY